MTRTCSFSTALILAGSLTACAHLNGGTRGQSSLRVLTPAARLAAIRRAQVWSATDVPAMDIRTGPTGPGSFMPNETVSCDYVVKRSSGSSPKFECAISPDDEVKVKYGQDNAEVFGEVASTRLLWALGFGADRMYPVRVICHGCPSGLGGAHQEPGNGTLFEYAAIERKMAGKEMDTAHITGWAWPELDLVDPKEGGASRAERDALKLVAVIIQHTDSKAEQQRLVCLSARKAITDNGQECPETFMMVNDLGQTFGHANIYNRNAVSVNYSEWSHTPVWKDPARCVGNLARSLTGTLIDPPISEEGRKFLAGLLAQLTDRQLHDLFAVSRFAERTGNGQAGTVDEWVAAFKAKRAEIVNHTCPS
jgi:hypothetical protein